LIKNLLQDLELDLSQLPLVVESDKTTMKEVFFYKGKANQNIKKL